MPKNENGDGTFLGRFGIQRGEKITELLNTAEARDFKASALEHFWVSYEVFREYLRPGEEDIPKPNISLAMSAIESAYVDLKRADNMHEMEDGPSPSQFAAALIAWLNRFRPVQVPEEADQDWLPFMNAIIALQAGLILKWQNEGIRTIPREIIEEGHYWEPLIYELMWRNPGYRELSTLLGIF